MNSKARYVKFQDIQNYLTEYYCKTNKCATLIQASNELNVQHKVSHEPTKMPDFSIWDIQKIPQLREIFSSVPINITAILEEPYSFNSCISEDYIGFSVRDVIANIYFHNEKTILHIHDYFEINYALQGSALLQCTNEKRNISEGELCIIAPHTQHIFQADQGSVIISILLKRSSFKIVFDNVLRNENLLSIFFNHSLYSSTPNYLMFTIPTTLEIRALIKHIFIESHSCKKYANEMCCNYVSLFFTMAMRNYSDTYVYSSTRENTMFHMPAILSYIEQNYRTITLPELAEFFNYERAYLGKQIKKATGMYFTDIVTEQKLKEAIHLLTYTKQPVNAIAKTVGYHSTDHFSRVFKKYNGISPTQYRKSTKEKNFSI